MAEQLYLIAAYQDVKISQPFILLTSACFEYLKPCLIFFFSWVIHMRSASFCLVKGQETQLSSKQEVKIAEDVLLLSTLKLGIASTLSQLHAGTQSIQKTSRRLDYS